MKAATCFSFIVMMMCVTAEAQVRSPSSATRGRRSTAPSFQAAPPSPLRSSREVSAADYRNDEFDATRVQRAQFTADDFADDGKQTRDYQPPPMSINASSEGEFGKGSADQGFELSFGADDTTNHGSRDSTYGQRVYQPPTRDLGPTNTATPSTTQSGYPAAGHVHPTPPPPAIPRATAPTRTGLQPRTTQSTPGMRTPVVPREVLANDRTPNTTRIPPMTRTDTEFVRDDNLDRNYTPPQYTPPVRSQATAPLTRQETTRQPVYQRPNYPQTNAPQTNLRQAQVSPQRSPTRDMIPPPIGNPMESIENAADSAVNAVGAGARGVSNAIRSGADQLAEEGRRRGNTYFMTLLALFASIGLNFYIGWIAYDTYNRYQDLVADMRYTKPRRFVKTDDSAYADPPLVESAAF